MDEEDFCYHIYFSNLYRSEEQHLGLDIRFLKCFYFTNKKVEIGFMNVFVITFLVSIKRDLLGDDSLSSFMTYFHDNSSEVWRQSFPQYHTICPPSVITQLFTNHSKYILLQHQKPLTTTQLRNRRKHYLFCWAGWQLVFKHIKKFFSSISQYEPFPATVKFAKVR